MSSTLDRVALALAPGSPYRGLAMAAATLVVLLFVHRATRRRLAAYLERQGSKPENAAAFLRSYTAVWKLVIAVVVLASASGSFAMLGLTVGFLATILGWALQVPIRGLAAWVMLVLKRPFRIGDRIAVADVTGDVVAIQLNHILLNQVGGTVQGEERSGRGIYVPNAILFGQEIVNYNYYGTRDAGRDASKFILDEVLVRVTLGSDYELATELCLEAARAAVGELVGETDQEPFTRVEFLPWGILIRLRYKAAPARRQEISSRVTERVWQAFRAHPGQVAFATPTSVASLEPSPGSAPPPMTEDAPSRP
jgi:small-conductance mechanosensitive channel